MKRFLLTFLVMTFVLAQVSAQTYVSLWKQATLAQQQDLPKTEIEVMEKIISKASLDKSYGNLLAAELRSVVLLSNISSDSIRPAIQRMEGQLASTSDETLKAIYHAVLGKLYKENCGTIDMDDSDEASEDKIFDRNTLKQQEYFRKALEKPALLAALRSVDYEPLVVQGQDGTSFRHDLLHVVGFEADTKEAYQVMHDYYLQSGNRAAACLCAYEITQKDRKDDVKLVRKSRYLQTIDSLINVYQDLPEAGELAVEHYRFMEGATDASVQDRLNYINYALSNWGSWSRMNDLRNAQKQLTEPMFEVRKFHQVWLPNKTLKIVLDEVRNIQQITLSISRLNITADNDYDVNNKKTYKMLLTKTSQLHQREVTKKYTGQPEWKILKDSFEIAPLPVGAYLLELTTDNTSIEPVRQLFYVSDLALMTQQLPSGANRYIVVSATTGQPIQGAKIRISSQGSKQTVKANLTTDKNGEATSKVSGNDIYINTKKDQYLPSTYVYSRRQKYYEQKNTYTYTTVYTDRRIYRPSQSVHVTAIQFSTAKGLETKAENDKEVKFTLRNANYKVVSEKTATTDEYGTASVDFELPQDGLTGTYSIRANNGSAHFLVEEYKRPTFEVTFPKVNQRYTWGDTVVVKASAKTYSGVPVQGAKVSYKVTRRSSLWWWRGRVADEEVFADTAATNEDGTFDIEIPLVKPTGETDADNRIARFFNFDVSATVTDLSGESHEGEMSLPLGTKATAFSLNLPELAEKDSLKQMMFNYRNSAGQDISSTVQYSIDKGKTFTAKSNTTINISDIIKTLPSGEHEVKAICEQDTLVQHFTLFSIADTKPAKHTTHWHYQTAQQFPTNGDPVHIQVGSSENSAYIAYSLIAGDNLIEKGTWLLSDSIINRAFTYKPEYATGLVLNYSFVKDGQEYDGTMKIERPLPDKRLNLTWKTFRNRLTPGQKEEWTLHVTTPDGKPAKAQLMSVLYDKSLDQITSHSWHLNLYISQTLPNSPWRNNLGLFSNTYSLGAVYPTKYYPTYRLNGDEFDNSGKYFSLLGGYYGYALAEESITVAGYGTTVGTRSKMAALSIRKDSQAVKEMSLVSAQEPSNALADEGYAAPVAMEAEATSNTNTSNNSLDAAQVRENLNETAFFYPALETDKDGNARLKFTLPESVTTWHFMGLAHDKEMRNGLLTDDAVAKKTVMVQPNQPRFLREGDKATLIAKVFNTSDKKVNGTARLQIIDPESNKVLVQKEQKFSINANGTESVSFNIENLKEGIYINKVVVAGNGYSDGEQHYLPVLSNKELITNTLPFTLHEEGEKTLDLTSLFADKYGKDSKHAQDAKVTIEYTNNPAWLMIQALPSVSTTNSNNAISLMTAIYSNTIAQYILNQSPSIKQVIALWKQEKGKETSLMSNLEKNQELKSLVLNETPWVLDADKESEQKKMLINYFDENQVEHRLTTQISKLKSLQNSDGSFSWWKDMPGNRYMTTAVVMMMTRLNKMVGVQQNTAKMLTSAFNYLHKKVAEEVSEMKKEEAKIKAEYEKKGKSKDLEAVLASVMPSECTLDYLYSLALDGRKSSGMTETNRAYLLKKLCARPADFTIYGKAHSAVTLALNGYTTKAKEYLQSMNEYTVYKEEMGRYYDTHKAYYSWFDYKIPTQVAAIEAMQLTASDMQTIEEMQRWLLMSKRTQSWDTPINCVNAVYAFMGIGNASTGMNFALLENNSENASMKIDGKNLSLPKASAGLGYVKTSKEGTFKTLSVQKKNVGTSWGAVYAQYTLPSSEVAKAASGISISRKVKVEEAKMGQKVKVIITLNADRDYDFVQVTDKRAACLEPVNQTSGYGYGYYIAPKDNATNYFFNRLAKGKHTITTEYYLDRVGDYQAGSCAVECAYSPKYSGHTEAYQLNVSK